MHPAAPLAVGAALLLSAWSVTSLQVDNRLTRMLDPTSDQAELYERFLEEYASDEFIVVAVSGKPLFTYEALDAMLEAQERLEAIPEAAHVSGLAQIFRDRFGAEDPESLHWEMTSTPFYRNLLINEEADIAGIIVEAIPLDGPDTRNELTRAVKEAVQPLVDFGFRVDVVGGPVFDAEINALSMGESMRYFPIAAVASLIMLLMLLRSGRAALAVVLCGGASILLTLGMLTASGESLNIVTSALPLILWVLSLASCIHVVTRFQHHFSGGRARREAVVKALQDVAGPCTLSAVTTAAGFLSLTLAQIPPIRSLGFWMAVGLLAALLINLVLCPALLLLFRARGARWLRPRGGRPFHLLAGWSMSRRFAVTAVFGVLFAATVVAIPFVKPQHDALGFLPDDSPVVEGFHFVGERLTGLDTMDVLVATPGSWLDTEYWPAIEAFCAALTEMPEVARVVSPLDFLKKSREWYAGRDASEYRLPDSREEAEYLLDQIDHADQEHLRRAIHRSGEEIRITVLLASTDSRVFFASYAAAQELLAELPQPLSAVITGRSPQMQHMDRQLVQSQITTFTAAFIAIFLCLVVGLRSFRLILAAVPPNLLPVLAVFAMMAVIGIPLDAGTVMVASIAMGIAVDDTVHVLAAFRRRRLRNDSACAIRETLFDVGPSITVTTFTAAAGFYCLALSIFKPIQFFGMLSGSAIVLALVTDLIALPAWLAMLYGVSRKEVAADRSASTRRAA